jgi:hypothetical protein
MATSSRQSNIFGVNDWKSIYKNYSQADFQSYDYETLRKVFVDYLRSNHPETFNDYVESSEYVALLDVIAYMGQALAFRNDLNTRENFIDTAERRDSVIKLANLVGYTPKRNLSGQGFVKITNISTTEQLRDINNVNLNNLTVIWNDVANPNWQQQFNTILNAALINAQRIGKPGHSSSIADIKTDEYSIQLGRNTRPVFPFTASINNVGMTFECVSVSGVNSSSLVEQNPGNTTNFNLLYRNDLLGYGSPNTGFFLYFKQGTLQTYPFSLSNQLANQTVDVPILGINNEDTWLYKVDPITGTLAEWDKVDSIYSSTSTKSVNKTVFGVTSGFNDQITLNFGDGVFGEIPVGDFTTFVRATSASTYTIDPSEFQGITIQIPYLSASNRTEILSIGIELTLPVTNAQARETLVNIKERAPQRYYTQNRMVNGEDYNNFPFTLYSSIIKSKALNRSSVGVSRNYDLLDPSARYSSTNDFSDDGGLFQIINDGFHNLTVSSNNDVVRFLTDTLASILKSNRAYQFYVQEFQRFTGTCDSGDGTVFWNMTTNDATECTGFFASVLSPISVGVFASNNVRYITEGAMLGFIPPDGFYFDENNRLVAGIPTASSITVLWTSVSNVVGDGSNAGTGNLSSGLGPVTLTNPVPNGAILVSIAPSFTNVLGNALIQNIITAITLNQSFTLVYDNTLLANQERWSMAAYDHPYYFVKFLSLGNNSYQVTYRSIAYYFGSVSNIRFVFDRDKVIFDPKSGELMKDTITVLKCNTQYGTHYPFSNEVKLEVVDQMIESDGYVDDYSVEVSTSDLTVPGTNKNPDFFYEVTGFNYGAANLQQFAFFNQVTDTNMLTRYEMIASSDVVFSYGTISDIALVKYDYPIGQIFYAVIENKFYKNVKNQAYANIVDLVVAPTYTARYGRQGLYFQYKHVSSDTNRVDPATTNIIDLYVLPQGYYVNYQNWLFDTTSKVVEPTAPTTTELSQNYSELNSYKMLTDSIILNCAKFKPLFGSKAETGLQAKIKVIKAATTNASDSEIITSVLTAINAYFNIDNWDFGSTFYFSELSAYLHSQIGDLISSAILVPNDPTLKFGDLYEVKSAPYEIFVNAATATDITVISALTPAELTPAG